MALRLPPIPTDEIKENIIWRNWFFRVFKALTTFSVTASATAGTSGALPAQVAGYYILNINGTDYKVPYYNM